MPAHDPTIPDAAPHGAEPRPSRSQRKRDVAEITRLGARLVTLPPDQLDALELDSDLHEEVVRCRTLQRAARNRQTKRIGKLLRARDHEAIRQACEHVAAANARSGGHRD